jgi:flavin reductase (DIM6/NTAB) family NADH-FMN oxidoreductase RutF
MFPRLVCLIATADKQGKPNVMTASFVMPVSFEPKYVAFSIAPTRYTFENLRAVKEFSLNICSKGMEEVAWLCGSYSGSDTDKFKLAKITPENSNMIRPPTVKECPISFECKVDSMVHVGDHWLVVGRVVAEHVRIEQFKPLMHKSGREFC